MTSNLADVEDIQVTVMAHYKYHKAWALITIASNPSFIINIIEDPCLTATLTIDQLILSATIINFEITAIAAYSETLDLTAPKVTSSESSVICPHPYSA